MDSDSERASLESIKDDSECIHVSNEPNLTGTCGDSFVGEEEGGGGDGVTDVNSSVAESELVPPEQGEGAVLNSVAEISDVVEGGIPVDVVSSVTEVGGGGEENAAFNVQEMDSVSSDAAAVEVVPLKSSSVVGEGGEEEHAALIGSDSQANSSGDRLEENKEKSMEEKPPSHDLNGVDTLNAEEKRDEGGHVVCGIMACEEIENDLGQNIESTQEKVDVMEEETTAQAASLVNDIEIPDDKEVASVAGFTEIPTQDKGLDDSVRNSGSEFVEEEPVKELQVGEGVKDLTDGDAKEGVDVTEDAMDIQSLKESEEENVDGTAVLEIETKPLEVDDVATEMSDKIEVSVDISSAVVTQFAGETSNDKETVMDDVKEDVEKDSEAGKSLDIHVPEAVGEVESDVKYSAGIEKEGDGMGGAGEAGQTVDMEEIREETQELSEELAKVDETKISEVSEETETTIRGEDQEKDDDMTDLAEAVETHGDSVAGIEEGREDHEDMRVTETQEETVMGKVDRTKIAEVSEETETRIEDEDQEKDDEMTDVAEDVKTHGDSSVADIEEERENHEEMTETQEESVMAEMGDEETDEVEEENKSAGGKRKRGRNIKTVKGTGKKKEEDVCFMCFDGGDLVLCDRRGCPKAYHPSCVDRDEAFFQSKGKWNCVSGLLYHCPCYTGSDSFWIVCEMDKSDYYQGYAHPFLCTVMTL